MPFHAASRPNFAGGALGVDLNVGHVSAALVDASGNPIEVYNYPCVTYGRSSDQAQDAVRKIAAKIAVLAKQLGVPVVAELLDFSERKKTLKVLIEILNLLRHRISTTTERVICLKYPIKKYLQVRYGNVFTGFVSISSNSPVLMIWLSV